jgi:hypothetical protein
MVNIWHVLPQNDTNPHIDYCIDMPGLPPICNCECNPTVICEENDAFIIVHNSFDGREGVEWATEILNS